MVDADTGQVLFQQDAHDELPASVTKIMTMLLVMEAVDDGKIDLTDEVTISQREQLPWAEARCIWRQVRHIPLKSCSRASQWPAPMTDVALAEYVAGSEEIFVERMNKRAEELGMRDTHFVNTNGLPVADHYSSAYDIKR